MGNPRAGGNTTDVQRMVRDEVRIQLQGMLHDQVERLQTMAGERGAKDGSQRAVTRGEIAGIGSATLLSVDLSIAPTAADYNLLRADMLALQAVLVRLTDTFK